MDLKTLVVFFVSLLLALFFGTWMTGRGCSKWLKHVVRGLVYGFFIAPVFVGPEGSVTPFFVSMVLNTYVGSGCLFPTFPYDLYSLLFVALVVSGISALIDKMRK